MEKVRNHFDIVVSTRREMAREKYGPSEVLLGLHKLIVFKYNFSRVRGFIEKFLMRCLGNTWEEIGQKVSLLGQWEFEGYRPNPLVR